MTRSSRTLRGCVDWNEKIKALNPEEQTSHPSRVRGLKYFPINFLFLNSSVAPFAGAWIEIVLPCDYHTKSFKSHPSRVRGLKLSVCFWVYTHFNVAPFAGAWIEIISSSCPSNCNFCRTLRGCVDWNVFWLVNKFNAVRVAPFAGAWIEI